MKPLLLILFFLSIGIQSQIKKEGTEKSRHLNAQKKMVIPVINDHPEKYDTDLFSKEIRKNVKDSIYITDMKNLLKP
ncbi:hypothetical protein [Chryseobacterium sp. SIMBA_028]|uniref:hypothetical protein n=1 Tax=Chryseobacterium sp. SIMBA_028 TaxID=3085771 RepID=UPI003979F1F0